MDIPYVIINGCETHCTVVDGHIRVVVSGPNSTEATRDFMYDIITCPECWARDERAMLAMAQAIHLTPEDIVALRRSVLRRKIYYNRN